MTTKESRGEKRRVGDMKQGLTGSRPKLSIVPRAAMIYITRPLEYGADKYARGNYHGPAPVGVTPVDRLLGYLDAAQRHITRVTESINRAMGTGGDMAAACSTVDDDGGGKFPASDLPDLSHAMASLAIGVSCAIEDGLMPADPGQPWKTALAQLKALAGGEYRGPLHGKSTEEIRAAQDIGELGLPQKDDPASERERVARLHERHAMPGHRLAEVTETKLRELEDLRDDVEKFDKEIADGFQAGRVRSEGVNQ